MQYQTRPVDQAAQPARHYRAAHFQGPPKLSLLITNKHANYITNLKPNRPRPKASNASPSRKPGTKGYARVKRSHDDLVSCPPAFSMLQSPLLAAVSCCRGFRKKIRITATTATQPAGRLPAPLCARCVPAPGWEPGFACVGAHEAEAKPPISAGGE